MAGRGSRFSSQGYSLPKPLIEIHGMPMVQVVIQSLRTQRPHRFIFLCLRDHLEQYRLEQKLRAWAPGCSVISVNAVTEGAACTVLLAKHLIDTDNPLMIVNSDQWVDFPLEQYLNKIDQEALDGLIMTMTADDPKWSFLRFDPEGTIVEVVEKQVVSQEATAGLYNYRRGKDFVQAAQQMIAKNFRVNNEFYVAPAYNEMIADGKKIGYFNIGLVGDRMFGMGIPSDLEYFLRHPISRKAVFQPA